MKPAFKLPTKLILPLGVLPGVPVGTFVVRSVGHLGKKKFKIYQAHYLPLKFLKLPKKQKSKLSPATH